MLHARGDVMADYSVLIVDDQPEFCRLAGEILESSSKFRVLGEAYDPDQALDKAEELMPDVVLIDVCLPGRDGFELAEQLLRRTPTLRIVMMSMYDEPGYLSRTQEVGALAFIPKSQFTAERVYEALSGGRGETDS